MTTIEPQQPRLSGADAVRPALAWLSSVVVVGVASVLLVGASTNLGPVTLAGRSVPVRPLVYLALLLGFVRMAIGFVVDRHKEAWSPSKVSMPVYAMAVFAVIANWLGDARFGVTPAEAFIRDGRFVLPTGLGVLNVFQPTWLHAVFDIEQGQYRPLKFLLMWAADHVRVGPLDGNALALIGGHLANGVLITLILQRFGVRAWVALMAGTVFLLHPITVSILVIPQIQYVWGTLLFLCAFWVCQSWCARPNGFQLVIWVGLYMLATLFIESWLGGAVVLGALVISQRSALPRAEAHRAIVQALVLLVIGLVVMTLVHINAQLALETSRLEMAMTLRGRRALLNLWFEPYWAYFIPLHARATLVQWLAVLPLVAVPAFVAAGAGARRYSVPAMWLVAGVSLGPALSFFEMTPQWSTLRLAYGPCAVLALCLGLAIAESRDSRVAVAWSTLCALATVLLCLIERGIA